jgi:hypothetical protein
VDDVDARVREVIELMLSGQWHSGLALELSRKYGVSVKAVQDWSRQAGRYLRFARGETEEFRERLLANLDYAGRLALTLKRTWIGSDGQPFESDSPDVKAYIAAQVEQGKLLRLDKPDEPEGSEQVPVEQLAAALRALGHEVKLNEPSRPNAAGAEQAGKERGEEDGEG